MLKTNDIEKLLLNKMSLGLTKDAGYDCPSGRRYVELRNVMFLVDKPYIFKNMKKYGRISPQWYEDNYTPKAATQIDNVVNRIVSCPETRQAVILMSDENGMMVDNICTMYMHIMLEKKENGQYDMEYIVHMRSSDAIEFGNDIEWHFKLLSTIKLQLMNHGLDICQNVKVIWVADTFHVYDHCFGNIFGND